jgi:antitoxin (DNA-binding transcriptional repressor) of toxin-antitoxin stability system
VPSVGIRELRADLAAHVRRAAAGATTVVSVGGRPSAVLGPLRATGDDAAPAAGADLAQLVAAGALIAPRRADGRAAAGAVTVWRNVRFDLLLREIRG